MLQRPARAVTRLAHAGTALLLALGVLYGFVAWHVLRDREESSMLSMAVMVSNAVDTYFSATEASLVTLRDTLSDDRSRPRAGAMLQRRLDDFASGRPEIQLVALVDGSGKMLAASRRDGITALPDIAGTPGFEEFRSAPRDSRHIYIGRPQRARSTGAWGLSVRLPIVDAHGVMTSHITILLRSDFLQALWRDAPSLQGGEMTLGIVRDDGYLLARHPLPEGLSLAEVFGRQGNWTIARHLKMSGGSRQGTMTGPAAFGQGAAMLHAYRRSNWLPLTVFVAQRESQLQHAWWIDAGAMAAVVLLLVASLQIGAAILRQREALWDTERLRTEDDLRRREESQRFLIDRMMAGLVVHDAQGAVTRANLEACRVLGLSFEQMIGRELVDPAWHFVRADGSVMPLDEYPVARVLRTRAAVTDLEFGVMKPGGVPVTWVTCRADPWLDASGGIEQVVVTFSDITATRDMLHTIADKEERFRSLFEHSMDAILLTGPDGSIHSANPAACRLLRVGEAQLKAGGRQAITDLDDPALHALLATRDREGQASGTLNFIRGDGTRFLAEVTSSIYADTNGQRYTSMIVRDITERILAQATLESTNEQLTQANARLTELAHYDPLTHLPNRALLTDRLQQAMAYGQRHARAFSVAFIDLDGFKEINDQHGHGVGDRLLMLMAEKFQHVLRAGDTVARLGGDEFVALVTDLADPHDSEALMQRLLAAAASPIDIDGLALAVSASVGVTHFPQDGVSADILIRHADQAMYLAKQQGKNRIQYFDVASDSALRDRRAQLRRIAQACERGELVLHYQPQVNMRTAEVVGVEALVRWQHPERGLLAPAAFLPLIEDDDLALRVGHCVLDLALQQLRVWCQQGLRLVVAVNVFARQLQQQNFLEDVRAHLARFPDVDPALLKLEVVETSALDDMGHAIAIIEGCARLGIGFALDDFGTGYSSLTYLKRLPAELLKIDQSFVRDILDDREDLNIVEGVIGLARAFDREVLAEGVETEAHARVLLDKGCTLGQGYGIARPMPAAGLAGWMQQWRDRQPWLS